MEFQRENRYTVLKISDIVEALDPDEKTTLIELEEKIDRYRKAEGKVSLECVVVESDWPEYEPTWKAIECRVVGVPRPAVESPCICLRCIKKADIRVHGLRTDMTQMIVCPKCFNKRCPHAADHRYMCTNSNEPGQPGREY